MDIQTPQNYHALNSPDHNNGSNERQQPCAPRTGGMVGQCQPPARLRIANDGTLICWNQATADLLEIDAPPVRYNLFQDILDPTDATHLRQLMQRQRSCRNVVLRLHTINHSDRWVVLNSRYLKADEAMLQQHEIELLPRRMADPLTGLPNRFALQSMGPVWLKKCREQQDALALLVFDLIQFRLINYALGTAVGDAVLVTLADRLYQYLAGYMHFSLLARTGSNEFAVLLYADKETTLRIAGEIRNLIGEPLATSGGTLSLRTSIGMITDAEQIAAFPQIMRRAGLEQTRAREVGGGIAVHEPVRNGTMSPVLQMIGDLHQAIDAASLNVYYMPIVDVATRTVVASEALLRWRHPQQGMLLPARILPLAEAAQLMPEVDRLVLARAIHDIGGLPTHKACLDLSINISATTLRDPALVAEWLEIIQGAGIDPRRIILELTERQAFEMTPAVLQNLIELRRAGLRIALDDIGSGYNSLLSLRHLPLDIVKIDRQFTSGLGLIERDELLVRAMLDLARRFDLAVVAEGVETELQYQWLNANGCDQVQGYLFGRPSPNVLTTGN
jgi:diguanylate cyclase (GGDEF)-like protein